MSMNRNVVFVGLAVLVLGSLVGAVLWNPASDATYPLGADEVKSVPAGLTSDLEDPGRSAYPTTTSDAEPVVVDSTAFSAHLADQIAAYRVENDRRPLRETATTARVTRTHAWEMYARGYLHTTGADGRTPVARYQGTATECSGVTEFVFQERRVAVGANGNERHLTSDGVAADVFVQLLQDPTMAETMASDEFTHLGVGAYVATEANDAGETVVVTTVTVDFCRASERRSD
jgi:uncharacterized protein YkwD